MEITIGRTSGPSTDTVSHLNIKETEFETVKDVLACVNAASGNKEKWYVETDEGIIVPYLN